MKEPDIRKPRKCRHCEGTLLGVTAKEIKAHAKDCARFKDSPVLVKRKPLKSDLIILPFEK